MSTELPSTQEKHVTIKCQRCAGTGTIESPDSTDDRWWDCSSCQGAGVRTIPDRRKPDPEVERLREALSKIAEEATGMYIRNLADEALRGDAR